MANKINIDIPVVERILIVETGWLNPSLGLETGENKEERRRMRRLYE